MMRKDKNENIPPELKALLEQKRQEMLAYNHSPLDEFAGLTPSQMSALFNDPWESLESPIKPQMATPDLVSSSLLCQSMLIALEYFSSEKGEKLTPQGRWPQKLLLKIYELGDADERSFGQKPRLEEDWPIANVLHGLLAEARLLRKSRDRMLTTKAGKQLLARPATAYEWIDVAFIRNFNWAYLDAYPEVQRVQHHWGFMVWLLLKYGNEERPVSFYSDAFLKAWPMFLDELPEDRFGRSREELFKHLFALRYIQRGFAWLSWVEYRYEGKGFDAEIWLKATPSFYQRWSVSS